MLTLAIWAVSPDSTPANLVGLWESATTSRGGIGHTFEFRADGEFVEATTVMVDGYFRLIGDRLVRGEQPVRPEADAGKAARLKFDGDVLVEIGPDGSVVRMERVSSGAKNQLVGVWRYCHYTDLVAFERYTDDGRTFFRLPMVSSVGCYSLNGTELHLVRPNQPDAMMTIKLAGEELSVEIAGRTASYRRATFGPWYETEHIVRNTGN